MRRVLVMGIVNVTPDSFSDGGRHEGLEAALSHSRRLLGEGADILDIGGESTRPGAAPVPLDEEIRRTAPLIRALRAETDAPISIDTMKPEVAQAAIEAGATIWNDVSALGFSKSSPAIAAELGCEVILMHMRGEPGTMQDAPYYQDVGREVRDHLLARMEAATSAGVRAERIWLDPGIGFGKRMLEHNLPLLRDLEALVALGPRVLLGASRKSFIGALDRNAPASERLGGSIAAALRGAQAGVRAVRVHDVRPTVQALAVWEATQAGSKEEEAQ